jgi:hypothetical protein
VTEELVGVTCDYDVEGQPCWLWTGHEGRHAATLRAAVEALPDFRDKLDSPWPFVSRRAVLALIDRRDLVLALSLGGGK